VRWPWHRRRPDVAEAQEHLDRLHGQQPEVDQLGRELRAARERNHFSEMVFESMRGRRAAPGR
jgi:hypothetical protein